jgi:dTDP-L-rhamnose 4-epimerase
MKALVTGGAGLIGSHIVDLWLAQGHQVVVLDNLEPQTHPYGKPDWIPAGVTWIQGDVRDAETWRQALPGVDVIFHQAAFGGFTPELSYYMDANATGTALMLEVIAQDDFHIQKIVAASSQAIYGEGVYESPALGIQYPQPRPLPQLEQGQWELLCPQTGQPMMPQRIREDKPYDGKTPYAISKYATERLVINSGQQLGIPTVALRYSVTYGPRQSIFNPYTGVVSIFSTRILNGLPPVIYEDGQQTRDFTYVEDIARANIFCMQNPACDHQVFNVGGGRRITVETLVRTLLKLYDREDLQPEMSGQLYRPGDARHMVPDPSRLEALGWRAEVSLDVGLRRYIDWIRTQGDIKEYFSDAQARLKALQVVRQRASSAG